MNYKELQHFNSFSTQDFRFYHDWEAFLIIIKGIPHLLSLGCLETPDWFDYGQPQAFLALGRFVPYLERP
jgi:hypothetical protein